MSATHPIPLPTPAPAILQLSHSSLGTYRNCRRRFYFYKLLALRLHEASHAGDTGNALHSAWYEWLRTGDKQRAIWTLMREYPVQFSTTPMASRSLELSYGALLALFESNALGDKQLAMIDVDGEARPAIEVPFAINLYNDDGNPITINTPNGPIPIQYIGYIDLILWCVRTQRFIVNDLKTTVLVHADYTPMYQFDTQCLPYAYVLEQMLDQPHDQLDVCYTVLHIDDVTPSVQTLPFTKTAADLEDWMCQLAMTVHQLQLHADLDWWPRDQRGCGTRHFCRFASNGMCASDNREYVEQTFKTILANTAPGNPRPPFKPWMTINLQLSNLRVLPNVNAKAS